MNQKHKKYQSAPLVRSNPPHAHLNQTQYQSQIKSLFLSLSLHPLDFLKAPPDLANTIFNIIWKR
jgi:hypothetical protein